MSTLDEEAEDGKIVALQSFSNAQLIQILQHHDGNDDLAQMVEEELARGATMTKDEADHLAEGDRVKSRQFRCTVVGTTAKTAERMLAA